MDFLFSLGLNIKIYLLFIFPDSGRTIEKSFHSDSIFAFIKADICFIQSPGRLFYHMLC